MLEAGLKAFGADFQADLLNGVDHPIAGLAAGVLATVLVQSSSVSTSTIVGLVGAGTLTVDAAVPMIMGANIGTTVTNTLVALASRGAARSSAALTPVPLCTISSTSLLWPCSSPSRSRRTFSREPPRRSHCCSVATWRIHGEEPDQAGGQRACELDRGWDRLADQLRRGPGRAVAGVRNPDHSARAGVITRNMRRLIASRVEAALNSLVSRGGGLVGMFFGVVITIAVQSSSITTSILVPLVGSGVLSVRNAYPITLGANLGTTITALLASLAVDLQAGLVVALTHTLFNLAAIVAIYPVRQIRYVPVQLAERLADLAVDHRAFVILYVGALFVVGPLLGIVIFGLRSLLMVMRFFRRRGPASLEQVQNQLLQMLAHDRDAFDAATATLLSDADAAVVGPALRSTDAEVNELEREIRRELVVHAACTARGTSPPSLST